MLGYMYLCQQFKGGKQWKGKKKNLIGSKEREKKQFGKELSTVTDPGVPGVYSLGTLPSSTIFDSPQQSKLESSTAIK